MKNPTEKQQMFLNLTERMIYENLTEEQINKELQDLAEMDEEEEATGI